MGSLLFSCSNQQTDKPRRETDFTDTTKIVTIDTSNFYMDENEISSYEWKGYKNDSIVNDSPIQVELNLSLIHI